MHASRMMACAGRMLMVLLAVAALSACDVVVTGLNANGKAVDEWTRTYPIAATGTLEILNTNGNITVTASDGAQIEVVAERTARGTTDDDAKEFLKRIEIREDVSGDRVRLETKAPTGEGGKAQVRYRVKVPASLAVRLQNSNGGIDVTALKGDFHAETTNGTVKGQELSGTATASTTNGTVKLQFDAVSGRIKAETVNGAVDITVPASAKAEINARCVNGGISLHGLSLEGGESTRRHVSGRLNGGGPAIEAETTNGGVRIAAK